MNDLRCPKCSIVITSRKFRHCTTCGAELLDDLVMTDEQLNKLSEIDTRARDSHEASMKWHRQTPSQDIRPADI
jgi:hypothetical protein